MAGRKSAVIDWPVIFEIYHDPRVAPADRAAEAMRRGVDRSAVQVERYFVAADLVCRYHATNLVSLSAVSDRVWHKLEERMLADPEEQVGSPDPDAAYRERDRILGQATRPMLERAAAGWHAWEAGQAIAAAEPAEPEADPPSGQGEGPGLEPLGERLRRLLGRLEYARRELDGAEDDPEYRRLAVGVMTLCRQAAKLVGDRPDADRLAAAVAPARALRSQVELLARRLRTR